jgi:hypothetical protein
VTTGHLDDLRSNCRILWLNDLILDRCHPVYLLQLLCVFDSHSIDHVSAIYVIVLVPLKRVVFLEVVILLISNRIARLLLYVPILHSDNFTVQVRVEADGSFVVFVLVLPIGVILRSGIIVLR